MYFLVPLDKLCTMDKLSQWNRILRQSRNAAQVLTAAVMAKGSLKVIERESGMSCPRRTRRASHLRKRHRSQTGISQCEDPRERKFSICRHRKTTTIPGWEENSPPQEVLEEGVIQSKVMDQMVSSAEDIQHSA